MKFSLLMLFGALWPFVANASNSLNSPEGVSVDKRELTELELSCANLLGHEILFETQIMGLVDDIQDVGGSCVFQSVVFWELMDCSTNERTRLAIARSKQTNWSTLREFDAIDQIDEYREELVSGGASVSLEKVESDAIKLGAELKGRTKVDADFCNRIALRRDGNKE